MRTESVSSPKPARVQRQGPQFLTLDPALHRIAANWLKGDTPRVDLIAALALPKTTVRPHRKVPSSK